MNSTNNIFRVLEDRGTTFLISQDGEKLYSAVLSGKMKNQDPEFLPTVGDWIQGNWQPGEWVYIESLVERKNLLARKSAGGGSLQKLGANLDYLLIATALNQDFNLNRLDRYVAMAYSCGIHPVILLTKADLVDNPGEFLDETTERFPFIDIHGVSTVENWNLDCLEKYLQPGKSVALVGSSGVGKSTLVNRVLGDEMLETGRIREDDGKGRHTTTHRSLHRLKNGAWLMDTPGLRGLALWDGEAGVSHLFNDIEAWSLQCKFTDCQHKTEPHCRIRQALENGELSEEKWKSYLKLQSEEAYHERKVDRFEAEKEKKRIKAIQKQLREKYK